MSSRRRTPSPPDLKTQDVVIFLSHAWRLSRVYLWTSSGHGFPVDGQVCCRTLRALGCTLEHQKYIVAGASRTQAHPFLIDLVRWLRKTVRSPPGLVRLPVSSCQVAAWSCQVAVWPCQVLPGRARCRCTSRRIRFGHETVYTCKETHEEQTGRGKHHQEPPSEPCAGATLVCAKLFPLIILFGCDTHPEAKSLILRLTAANAPRCSSTLHFSSS